MHIHRYVVVFENGQEDVIYSRDPQEAAIRAAFYRAPRVHFIESDSGPITIVGYCESCNRPVMEAENYGYNADDDLHFCARCVVELSNTES